MRSMSTTLLVLCLAITPATAQSELGAAQWMPEEVVAYLGITDWEAVKRDFERTAAMKLMKDERLSGAMEEMRFFRAFSERISAQLAEVLQRPADTIENPLGGALGFGLVAPTRSDADDGGMLFIAEVKKRGLMSEYYSSIVEQLRAQMNDYERVDVSGERVDVFRDPRAQEGDGADSDSSEFQMNDAGALSDAFVDEIMGEFFSRESLPEELALCFTEDRLYVALDADTIRRAMRAERSEQSLAGVAEFRQIRRRFDPLGNVHFFVNIPRIRALAMEEADAEGRQTMQAMGVGAFGPLVGHTRFDFERYELRQDLFVEMRGERRGVAKLLMRENTSVAPPTHISEDMVGALVLQIEPAELVDEIERTIRATDPATADMMRNTLTSVPLPDGGMMNVREQVISNLRGPLVFGMGFAKPYGPGSFRWMLSMDHRDEAALSRALEIVRSIVPIMLEREVDGRLVYDVPQGRATVAVDGKRLYIGHTESVEPALRGGAQDRAVARTAAYRSVERLLEQRGWAGFFVDGKRYYEAMLGLLSNKAALEASQFADPTNAIGLALVESTFPGINPKQANSLRGMIDYGTPTIGVIRTEADGIRLEYVYGKP